MATTNNNITYHGEVSVAIKVKDKITRITRYNNGTPVLFKALVIALIDGYYSKIPTFIALTNDTTDENKVISRLTEKTYYEDTVSVNDETQKIWKAKFGTLITPKLNAAYNSLQLLDKNKDVLASVSINDIPDTGEGVSLLVEWDLYFDNTNGVSEQYTAPVSN